MARTGGALAPPTLVPAGGAGWPVWGHDDAVGELRRALADDRLPHALLIAGAEGVGKRALALALAQAASCQDSDRPDRTVPCGVCLACRKIGRGVHPDVETYGLASQTAAAEKGGGKNTSLTIETVRSLASSISLKPIEAARRFVIIDDAETMQGVAQEALLKTLEEPPRSVVILLLADQAEALLATVRSRCRLVSLRPVPKPTIEGLLRAVAGDDSTEADRAITAGLANGRPGWALRALAEPGLVEGRRAAAERALAVIDGDGYDRLVAAVRLGDGFTKRRGEVFAELEAMLGVWRDAMLIRAGLAAHALHPEALGRLRGVVEAWELPALAGAVRAVQTCIADLEANVRPRLALEAMVLAWPTRPRR